MTTNASLTPISTLATTNASLIPVSTSVTRHTDYYLDSVVFEVQNTIYRVPRFQFERHSSIFAATFSLPPADDVAEGSSEAKPLKLEGINRLDFERLLKVLYPLTPVFKTPNLTNTEWLSVLKMANMWDFLEVRELAIEKLGDHATSSDCVERILLGRQYNVSSWARSGYADLAKRETSISVEDAAKIGLEATVQIFKLRESLLKTDSLKTLELGDLFKAELQQMDSAHDPSSPPLPALPGPDVKINFNTSVPLESGKNKKLRVRFPAPSSTTSALPTSPFSFNPATPAVATTSS
ncbi:hypothetical protein FB45DRAFT_1019981 [Roridomyces roridus]|uniref:BTB domain-containing protein n=1 Tax=Roridomyces roridus TaxID=1738132 RepID=A0AAD7CG68_9AGAR|nr:hypothetical protein FB45DRAFT_1019981 [Roridomyces roridus]